MSVRKYVILNATKMRKLIKQECSGCATQEGGWHGVAPLMWLRRRSEEPPCASVKCYWPNARLSTIGSNLKFIEAFHITH
ncbi:unnamed protein product [Acanthoscelides obtectus]|uniref:Uncharacterized protein n=1 Tax=Acanthoscelides obtectus TaxID=200917 RepID=A0A9P0LHP5_ACAOB|nr:unnamed protein product [Acanthoscelides obtectus]CAK1624154.1 hypothetical protein AOBTE_LOCUS2354 [Acanthoscelides obtectus]